MPTDLSTVSKDDVFVRFKAPLLSESLNRSQLVFPRGVYRGFNLTTSASALSVTVALDPVEADSVAIVHDVDDRALTIRLTSALELDLTSFASKTVVIAIYARHLSQGTTVAVVRGYELSPSDEYTADPNVGNLIVLGTVVVPAAGLIADTSITHEKRTVVTDNEFANRNRIALVLNHDFRQSGHSAATYIRPGDGSYEGDVAPISPHWFAEGDNALSGDTGYKPDGNGLVIQTSAAGDYEVKLYQDVSYTLGDIDASNGDWLLQFEVNYDVIAVSTGGDGTLEFRIYAAAPDNSAGTYLVQKTLDVTATGTNLVASGLVDLVTLLPDFGTALGTYGTARITSVMFSGTDAASQVNTDLYRINSVQVWLVNNRATAGHKDPQAREDKGKGWPVLRGMSLMSRPAGSSPASPTFTMDELPRIGVSQSARFGSGNVVSLENAAFRLQQTLAVEDNLSGTNRNKPRFRGEYDSIVVLTNILEAVSSSGDNSDSGFRIVASPNGVLHITANADTATGLWDKDVDGDPAAAIRIDGNAGTLEFLTRAAGAGTWNDSSWTQTLNLLSRGVTATITDGTTHTNGDHNGANAIDVVENVYPAGRYFLRSGNHTLNATSAITNNTKLIGESDPVVSSSNRTYLFPNAGMVSNQDLEVNLESIHVRNGTAGRWVLKGSGAKNCKFEAGVLVDAVERSHFVNCRFSQDQDVTNDAIAYTVEMNASSGSAGVLFENCLFDSPGASASGVAAVRITGSNFIDDDTGFVFRNCEFVGTSFIGANNGTSALEISDDTRAVFEECKFLGSCDDVFTINILASAHLNGVVFRNCTIVNDNGKCMAIGGDTTDASVTLENVVMKAGTVTPTSGKGQMFTFAGGGEIRMRDVSFLMKASVIDTGVAPTFPPIEIGGLNGSASTNTPSDCSIDGLSILLDSGGVPTRETLLVHEMGNSVIRDVVCDVNGFAPSNNGLGTYTEAAYISIAGSASNVHRLENIRLTGVDMPSHVDTRAGVYAQYCQINGISYDGPASPTAAGGGLHQGKGAIHLSNSSVSGVFIGRQYNPNPGSGNGARLVYLSDSTIVRGALYSIGVDSAERLFELGPGSTVGGISIDVSGMSNVYAVFELVGEGSAVQNCLIECAPPPAGGPTNVILSASHNCIITGNRIIMPNGGFDFVDLTGNRCLVDSNILFAYSLVPSITNSGVQSVTGDNVIS